MLVAWEPGDVAKFRGIWVASTSTVLGAYKFLIMPDFDVEQLIGEVQAPCLNVDRQNEWKIRKLQPAMSLEY
ncbi:MAG: hypothetical protein U0103_10955 [Candidatus Obscuribacterales bacterium]